MSVCTLRALPSLNELIDDERDVRARSRVGDTWRLDALEFDVREEFDLGVPFKLDLGEDVSAADAHSSSSSGAFRSCTDVEADLRFSLESIAQRGAPVSNAS